jgi:hypothetical protein
VSIPRRFIVSPSEKDAPSLLFNSTAHFISSAQIMKFRMHSISLLRSLSVSTSSVLLIQSITLPIHCRLCTCLFADGADKYQIWQQRRSFLPLNGVENHQPQSHSLSLRSLLFSISNHEATSLAFAASQRHSATDRII